MSGEGKEPTAHLDAVWEDALLTASVQLPTGHLRLLLTPSLCPCIQCMPSFSCQEDRSLLIPAKHRTRADTTGDHREPGVQAQSWASQWWGQPLGYNLDLSKNRWTFDGNSAWATCDGWSPSWLCICWQISQQGLSLWECFRGDLIRWVLRRARKDINLDCRVYWVWTKKMILGLQELVALEESSWGVGSRASTPPAVAGVWMICGGLNSSSCQMHSHFQMYSHFPRSAALGCRASIYRILFFSFLLATGELIR